MIWQLLQVGYIKDRPLILLGEMWTGLLDWMRKEMVPQRVSPQDIEIARVVTTMEEALAIIKESKRKFDRAMASV